MGVSKLVCGLIWIIATSHIVLSRHTRILGLPQHRIRHSNNRIDSQVISNAVQANSGLVSEALSSSESSERVEALQRDILQSLGMSEPPTNRVEISDHMREVIIQNADRATTEIEEEEHFMKDSVNIVLTAKKAVRQEHGEVMEFTLGPQDRGDEIIETKLYFHINPLMIEMDNNNITVPMKLRLSMLSEAANGSNTMQTLDDDITIHSHLVGWHNHEINSDLLKDTLEQPGSEELKLIFKLQCMNCQYEVFPAVITKQNVPFLTMNGRRRGRRNGSRGCTGSCCLKELIVDFNALGSKWDFVIHPRRYQANYCSGSCSNPTPMDRALMTSNTHILNEVLSRQREAATTSCCVAADEERLVLVYMDGGNVRTNYDAIKRINSCRCV